MLRDLIPHKAPELLYRMVDKHNAYAVNCSYPNSFRVLNKAQIRVLDAINGRDNIDTIADRLSLSPIALEKFVLLLHKTEIVRFDKHFGTPQKPKKPTSLNFWIHTTNACNLGCSYCYISTLNTGKAMSFAVQQQLITKLVQTASNNDIKSIKLRLAGGEPMTHFGLWKAFIPQAKKALANASCNLEVSFLTNLTILNDDIIAFSKQHRISYGVSLDGIGEIHNTTRQLRSGAGTFDIVDANIRNLIANDVAVSVNTVVNNFNLIGMPDLTRYLVGLDIPFRYSIVKGESINSELLDEYLSKSYEVMRDAIAEGWQFAKRYRFCDLKPNELGFQTCASGFSGGAIYTDGSFKYCHVHFGKEGHSIQTIFDENLDLIEMIEQSEHHEDRKSEDCKKCRYRFVCTSGCPVYRQKDKDPQCSIYHKFIPKHYELQAIERLHLLSKCETI